MVTTNKDPSALSGQINIFYVLRCTGEFRDGSWRDELAASISCPQHLSERN
jgi:hypothetical protein